MTYMINVSDTMRMLLERMDKFPDEFVNSGRSVASYSIDDLYADTRWDSISVAIMGSRYSSQHTVHSIFTAEEVNAYRDKMGKLIRKQVDECICSELLNPLRNNGMGIGIPDGMQRDMFRDDLANNKLYNPYQNAYPQASSFAQSQPPNSFIEQKHLAQELKKLGLIDVLKKKFQNL